MRGQKASHGTKNHTDRFVALGSCYPVDRCKFRFSEKQQYDHWGSRVRDLSGCQLRPNQLSHQLAASVTCVMAREADVGAILSHGWILRPNRSQIERGCRLKGLENGEATVWNYERQLPEGCVSWWEECLLF
jgi:hypothetical protein